MTKRRRRDLPDTPEVRALVMAELDRATNKLRVSRDALEVAEAALQEAEDRFDRATKALKES